MATFRDTTPDKIVQIGSGHYLFIFSGGLDDSKLPIGAEYVVVYSPGGYNRRWHATSYQVIPTESKKATCKGKTCSP